MAHKYGMHGALGDQAWTKRKGLIFHIASKRDDCEDACVSRHERVGSRRERERTVKDVCIRNHEQNEEEKKVPVKDKLAWRGTYALLVQL